MRLALVIAAAVLAPATARRLLSGVPRAIDVPVACNQSHSCNHGDCRSGFCLCENGWTTLEHDDEPCNTQGKSQLLVLIICWLFGWLGAGAFLLHWWWYGGGILVSGCSACFSGLYYMGKTEKNPGDYAAANEDKDDNCCVPASGCCACLSCCTWCSLTLFVSICACFTAYCVSANGAPVSYTHLTLPTILLV